LLLFSCQNGGLGESFAFAFAACRTRRTGLPALFACPDRDSSSSLLLLFGASIFSDCIENTVEVIFLSSLLNYGGISFHLDIVNLRLLPNATRMETRINSLIKIRK